MLKQTKKAFTLVELIIVITILAILATIGFMSYQSYTADARNSKRSTDISSLQSKLEVKIAKNATDILNFGSWIAVTNEFVAWTNKVGSWTTLTWWTSWNYVAWDIKYATFDVDSKEFLDPGANKKLYKFAAAKTTLGNLYQFAATIEATDGSGNKWLVKWLFLTWWTSDNSVWLMRWTWSVSSTASWMINDTVNSYPYDL